MMQKEEADDGVESTRYQLGQILRAARDRGQTSRAGQVGAKARDQVVRQVEGCHVEAALQGAAR